jgi:hypothetical protein
MLYHGSLIRNLMKYLATSVLSIVMVLAFLLLPFLSTGVQAAGEVDLSLMPNSQTVQAGSSFNVDIQIKCNGQEIDGVEVFLDFDPRYLEVQSMEGGSTLDFPFPNKYDNQQGTLMYSAGTLNTPLPSNTFIIASITFMTKAVTSSVTTPISFHLTDPRTTVVDYGGKAVPNNTTGATVTLQNNPVTPVTTTSSPVPSNSPTSTSPAASPSTSTVTTTSQRTSTTLVQTASTASTFSPVQSNTPATTATPTGTSSPTVTTVPMIGTAPVITTSPIQTPGQTTITTSLSKTSTVPAAGTSTAISTTPQTAITSTSSPVVPPNVPTTTSLPPSPHTNWNLIIGIIGAVLIVILVLLLVYWKRLGKKVGK